jgi:hypothetical protein
VHSEQYEILYKAIKYEVPVKAKYNGHERKFWPMVLGTSETDEELVFVWEFLLDGTPVDQWRCFKVQGFPSLGTTLGGPDKPDLPGGQNCVKYPDSTLPLP